MNGRDIDSAVLIALQRLEKLTPKRKEILLSFGALPSALLREELRQKVTAALGESATDFSVSWTSAKAISIPSPQRA